MSRDWQEAAVSTNGLAAARAGSWITSAIAWCEGTVAHWLTPRLAVTGFLLVVLAVAYKTIRLLVVPEQPQAQGWGLIDFRDAVYFPVVSFLDGNNPYEPAAYMATYPVGNIFPLYLPVTLLLHLPFGLLPFAGAEVAYFLTTAALVPLLAYLTLRLCHLEPTIAKVFGLALLIQISEPGHWNLFLGQCTAQLAVAVYAALYFARRRPWLAAISVAVASFKPTSGVPLVLLMLSLGDSKAVFRGIVLGGIVSAAVGAALLRNAGGVGPFLASLGRNYSASYLDVTANPLTSPYRVDVAATITHFLGDSPGILGELAIFSCILAITALALRRLSAARSDAGGPLSASLVCLAVLMCTYHQSYDLLLLALPCVAAATSRLDPTIRAGSWSRRVLLVALSVPAVNYLVDGWTLGKLHLQGVWWLAVTSLNGVALLVALVMLWWMALRARADAATC